MQHTLSGGGALVSPRDPAPSGVTGTATGSSFTKCRLRASALTLRELASLRARHRELVEAQCGVGSAGNIQDKSGIMTDSEDKENTLLGDSGYYSLHSSHSRLPPATPPHTVPHTAPHTPHTPHAALHTPHTAPHTTPRAAHTAPHTPHTAPHTPHTAPHTAPHTPHTAPHTTPRAAHTAPHAAHTAPTTLHTHTAPHTPHAAPHAPYTAPHTPHTTPHTPHTVPHTQHTAPHTTPYTAPHTPHAPHIAPHTPHTAHHTPHTATHAPHTAPHIPHTAPHTTPHTPNAAPKTHNTTITRTLPSRYHSSSFHAMPSHVLPPPPHRAPHAPSTAPKPTSHTPHTHRPPSYHLTLGPRCRRPVYISDNLHQKDPEVATGGTTGNANTSCLSFTLPRWQRDPKAGSSAKVSSSTSQLCVGRYNNYIYVKSVTHRDGEHSVPAPRRPQRCGSLQVLQSATTRDSVAAPGKNAANTSVDAMCTLPRYKVRQPRPEMVRRSRGQSPPSAGTLSRSVSVSELRVSAATGPVAKRNLVPSTNSAFTPVPTSAVVTRRMTSLHENDDSTEIISHPLRRSRSTISSRHLRTGTALSRVWEARSSDHNNNDAKDIWTSAGMRRLSSKTESLRNMHLVANRGGSAWRYESQRIEAGIDLQGFRKRHAHHSRSSFLQLHLAVANCNVDRPTEGSNVDKSLYRSYNLELAPKKDSGISRSDSISISPVSDTEAAPSLHRPVAIRGSALVRPRCRPRPICERTSPVELKVSEMQQRQQQEQQQQQLTFKETAV